MRTLRVLALISSALVSVVIIVVTTPLLVLMRRDRHARMRADDRWHEYDDNDPGLDVDGDP